MAALMLTGASFPLHSMR
uniref:Uncharacterized protein n=1 Tax=Anguilla anguilla TaxID=7936 RepID=A0A0E9SQS1_ANGAN